MTRSTEVALATAGCAFEHHGVRFVVPEFSLAAGGALALVLPRTAASEAEANGQASTEESLADDLGESLLGLAPLADGAVALFGRRLGSGARTAELAVRRRIAFAPLRPAFLSTVTVPDNVAIPRRDRLDPPDGELARDVLLKLGALDVPIVGRVLPGHLSPRRRYLAGIARALLAEPELLVLALPEVELPRELVAILAGELAAARARGAALLLLGGDGGRGYAAVEHVLHVQRRTRSPEPLRSGPP